MCSGKDVRAFPTECVNKTQKPETVYSLGKAIMAECVTAAKLPAHKQEITFSTSKIYGDLQALELVFNLSSTFQN